MGIIWSGLAPHPPIIVADVGRDRCREAQTTIDSMKALARDMVSQQPQRLIVISPHTPRPRRGIAVWLETQIAGHFGQFGAPESRVNLAVDQAWMTAFSKAYPQTSDLGYDPLDHGAMVPLHFLTEAGWEGPTCVVGLPWDEGPELERIGEAVAAACNDEVPTALVASGDMSHCLKPGAPCGYRQEGPIFDKSFVAHLQKADFRGAAGIDAHLRENARQDVVESCRIAWTATGYQHDNHHFFSYEGPFGVGYTVMKFFGVAS